MIMTYEEEEITLSKYHARKNSKCISEQSKLLLGRHNFLKAQLDQYCVNVHLNLYS